MEVTTCKMTLQNPLTRWSCHHSFILSFLILLQLKQNESSNSFYLERRKADPCFSLGVSPSSRDVGSLADFRNGTGGLSNSGKTAVDMGVINLKYGVSHIDTAQVSRHP